MSAKARATIAGKNGAPVTVYAELHGDTVWMHTAAQNLGGYKIERFTDKTLTAASLRAVLTREDTPA